jgi:hypothetical protein
MSRADQSLSRDPEEVLAGFVDADPLAHAGRPADDVTELGLDVEPDAWAIDGHRVLRPLALAAGTVEGGAGHDHRARSAVVADGQVLPVDRKGR